MKWIRAIQHTVTDFRKMAAGILAGTATINTLPVTQPEAKADGPTTPPNIILILADDLGWTDINCRPLARDVSDPNLYLFQTEPNNPNIYETDPNIIADNITDAETYDSSFYETPNLARLRQEAVRFTNACVYPWCKATRMSLLTGKNYERCIAAQITAANKKLSLAEKTIAEVLDAGGVDYYCGWFGKHHSDDIPGDNDTGHNPSTQGFDKHEHFETLGFCDSNYRNTSPPTFTRSDGKDLTDVLTDEALNFIDEANVQGKPFFLYLPYYAPHNPIVCPVADSDHFKGKLGLEAYWRFKNVSVTNMAADYLEDSSAHYGTEGNYGLINNGAVSVSGGAVNYYTYRSGDNKDGCVQLNGSTQYLQTKGNTSQYITGSSPRSVTAWIKTISHTSAGQDDGTIISWGEPFVAGGQWRMDVKGGKLKLGVGAGEIIGNDVISDGQSEVWHHVAAVYSNTDINDDGYVNQGDVVLYVDGQVQQATTSSTVINTTANTKIWIGQWNNVNYFNGNIDDVRIYKRALSGGEIEGIANQTLHENVYFAGMIRRLDDNIGKIMDHLENNGLTNDTAIIFLSDNGGTPVQSIENYASMVDAANSFCYGTKNYPLRDYKLSIYEGGIRVPMIIKMPGFQPEVCKEPVTAADILPTIYNIAYGEGAFDRSKHLVDGKSLLPLIANPDPATTAFERTYHEWYSEVGWYDSHYFSNAIYCFNGDASQAIRQGNLKMLKSAELNELYDVSTPSTVTGYFEDSNDNKYFDPAYFDERDKLQDKLGYWLESFKVRVYDSNGTFRDSTDTIAAALGYASTGDIVVLPPATFYETLDLDNKTVTLCSVDPDDIAIVEATIIDGAITNSVNATFTGITLANYDMHWTLDDKESLQVKNRLNEHHGKVKVKSPATAPISRLGCCLAFDGNSDYILADNYTGISGCEARTVSAWIKLNSSFNQNGQIVSWGHLQTAEKWMFRVEFVSGSPYLGVGLYGDWIRSNVILQTEQWYHVVAVLNGQTVDNILLYIDGQLQTDITNAGVYETINTAVSNDVTIGAWYDGSSALSHFKGLIDDVQIYSRALDGHEIMNLSNGVDVDSANLELHYAFNEGTGSAVYDASDHSRDGTLYGGPEWITCEGADSALELNGYEFVDLGSDSTILDNAEAFSISVWVKPNQVPFASHEGIVGFGDSSRRSPWIWGKSGTSKLRAAFYNEVGTVDGSLESTNDLQADTWTHVTVTWDGSTCRLYLNGNQEDFAGTTGTSLVDSNGIKYIGYTSGLNYWNGLLDDLRVYNRALSDIEVSDVVTNNPPSIDLIAHWDFSDIDGYMVSDLCNAYDGVVQPNATWTLGVIGGALQFAGDDYVEVEGYKGVLGSKARTCSAWINTNEHSVEEGAIVSWGRPLAAGGQWRMSVRNGKLMIGVGAGSIIGDQTVNDGGWHHVAAILEDASNPTLANVSIYVDGTLQQINGTPAPTAINTLSGYNVIIGQWFHQDIWANYPYFFKGSIDDVRIYDRALSETELEALAGVNL